MAVHDEHQFQVSIAKETVATGQWRKRPATDVDKTTRLNWTT